MYNVIFVLLLIINNRVVSLLSTQLTPHLTEQATIASSIISTSQNSILLWTASQQDITTVIPKRGENQTTSMTDRSTTQSDTTVTGIVTSKVTQIPTSPISSTQFGGTSIEATSVYPSTSNIISRDDGTEQLQQSTIPSTPFGGTSIKTEIENSNTTSTENGIISVTTITDQLLPSTVISTPFGGTSIEASTENQPTSYILSTDHGASSTVITDQLLQSSVPSTQFSNIISITQISHQSLSTDQIMEEDSTIFSTWMETSDKSLPLTSLSSHILSTIMDYPTTKDTIATDTVESQTQTIVFPTTEISSTDLEDGQTTILQTSIVAISTYLGDDQTTISSDSLTSALTQATGTMEASMNSVSTIPSSTSMSTSILRSTEIMSTRTTVLASSSSIEYITSPVYETSSSTEITTAPTTDTETTTATTTDTETTTAATTDTETTTAATTDTETTTATTTDTETTTAATTDTETTTSPTTDTETTAATTTDTETTTAPTTDTETTTAPTTDTEITAAPTTDTETTTAPTTDIKTTTAPTTATETTTAPTTATETTTDFMYGPRSITLIPSYLSYTYTEGDNSSLINCTADCNPQCIIIWTGPNLPPGISSVLTLQKINKNQAGSYTCTASNSHGNLTSGNVNVDVNYGPYNITINPPIHTYIVDENDSINPIVCYSDCKPECTITWIGPKFRYNASRILNLTNISKDHEGEYGLSVCNVVRCYTHMNIVIVHVQALTTEQTTDLTTEQTTDLTTEQTTDFTTSSSNTPGFITINNITRTGKLHDSSSINITCTASLTGNIGNVTVTWKLNITNISPSPKWKIAEIKEGNSVRSYQLNVKPLQTRDSGNYSCLLSDGEVQAERSLWLCVIGRPKVSVSPMSAIVDEGKLFSIQCTVDESYGVNTTLYAYKDGVLFNTTIDVKKTKNYTIRADQSAIFKFYGQNEVGKGEMVTSRITVKQKDAKYKECPELRDLFDMVWNMTIDSTTVVKACTGDYSGNVSRYCNKEGQWEDPNYSGCVKKAIDELNKQSEDLKNGLEVSVDNILETLKNQTVTSQNKTTQLRSGDLETSSSTLDNIAKYTSDGNKTVNITHDQLTTFAESCDNLLNPNNKPSWQQLKKENLTGVTRIANAVATFVKAYAASKSGEFNESIPKENIVVQVGRTGSKSLVLPGGSNEPNDWIKKSGTEVKLNVQKDEGTVGYSTAFYRDISDLFHPYIVSDGKVKSTADEYIVNSVVVDLSMEEQPKEPGALVVEFHHLQTNYTGPLCGFWNFNVPHTPNGAWSTYGSKLLSFTNTSTKCEYNHTTNFAILMSPSRTPSSHLLVLTLISMVGCSISVIFLTVTIFLYSWLWRYTKSDRATILMNLCIALILSYVLFFVGVTKTEYKNVCTAIAIALHYIFLVDFSLMLAEGVEIAFSVLYVFHANSKTRWLVSLSWIVPVIIVGISAGATKLEGYGNADYCWLTADSGLLWAFIGPVLLVILINIIIILVVLKTMFNSHTMLTKSTVEKGKSGVRSICVLLPLFGITWLLGVFAINDDVIIFQYLFAIFNSLQGFMIFVFHCLLNKKVRDGIRHVARKRRTLQYMDSKTSTGKKKHSSLPTENSQLDSSRYFEKSHKSLIPRSDYNQEEQDGYIRQDIAVSDDGNGFTDILKDAVSDYTSHQLNGTRHRNFQGQLPRLQFSRQDKNQNDRKFLYSNQSSMGDISLTYMGNIPQVRSEGLHRIHSEYNQRRDYKF